MQGGWRQPATGGKSDFASWNAGRLRFRPSTRLVGFFVAKGIELLMIEPDGLLF
jgi:hypothetical protein